jgi:RNA polymerase sigma-70 factor (ECF subfamily)
MLRSRRESCVLRRLEWGGLRMSMSATGPAAVPGAEAIWREFHDGLLGFISRRVPSRETAEDILQDVMLRIHRSAAGVERAEAVGAWVHAIARNAIVDYYRSASVRRELAGGSEIDLEAEVGEPDADPPDVRGELAACVAPLLRQLSPSFRDALTLTELEGMTQEEAAARMGLSLSGMKSRVQRARRQLKQVLVQCCEIERDVRGGLTDYRPRRGSCECSTQPSSSSSKGGAD